MPTKKPSNKKATGKSKSAPKSISKRTKAKAPKNIETQENKNDQLQQTEYYITKQDNLDIQHNIDTNKNLFEKEQEDIQISQDTQELDQAIRSDKKYLIIAIATAISAAVLLYFI